MNRFTLIIFSFLLSLMAVSQDIDQKVDSLLALMTLDEKIGQMTQAERGMLEVITDIETYKLGSLLSGGGSSPDPNSVAAWADMYDEYQSHAMQTRLSIPLIYGVDAVHGHNNLYGAVIFPHNIGMGATWNPELFKAASEITAREVAATGIDWTFSPCIAVPQNERWGRTYEGFGETAEINEMMGAAAIEGFQGGDLSKPETILACAKHFVGDGGTTDGIDQGNTAVSEEILRALHMAGYIDAIDAGVGSIMASFNSWNGEKLHGHEYLLTEVLKEELGFEGFIISDWKGVDQVDEDYREAVKRSINAGIDMVMVPDRYIYFISLLKDLVEKNEVSMNRIDDAVCRILKQKFLLNLFEEPYTDPSFAVDVGSDAHRDVARRAVRESLVLLNAKNDLLPLQKNGQKLLVAGSLADDLGGQCGGWSISWQGSNGNITEGTTILEGIQEMAGTTEIIYAPDGETSETVDAAVVVIGENPYTEGAGDRESLDMSAADVKLIKDLKGKGIPVITLLVSGRPMIIGELLPYTDAFVAVWLPGTEGKGIAEILFGDFQPSGKLTNSWPTHMGQVPINVQDEDYNPLYPYKHGLQAFPNSETAEGLSTYAAVTSNGGETIILTLTDEVIENMGNANDFQVKLDGITQNGLIETVEISDLDTGILELHLTSPITSEEIEISLSYSGDGLNSEVGKLEHFTGLFVYNAVKYFGAPHAIPGRIQAEEWTEMSGVGKEDCEDVGGGTNVGWIDSGDWIEYNVEVATTGNYKLVARVAGYAPGTIYFSFDDEQTATVDFESTEGWQSWEDFSTTVPLEAGNYSMRVDFNSDAFNLNYYDFISQTSVDEHTESIREISVYPNPVRHSFSLNFSDDFRSEVKINLFDMAGKKVQPLYEGRTNAGYQ